MLWATQVLCHHLIGLGGKSENGNHSAGTDKISRVYFFGDSWKPISQIINGLLCVHSQTLEKEQFD
jgi:hypothetical protein